MKNLTILVSLVTFLLGCASASKVMTPSGKMGYSIECNGTAVSMTVCYEKASDVCPRGYNIIDTNSRAGFSGGYATSHKGIFIECK